MFVLLSKTLDVFLSPLSWALLLLLGALAFRRRRNGWSTSCTLAALGILVLFSSPWVANRIMAAVEASARNTFDASTTYDAVIVLGGGLEAGRTHESSRLEFNMAPERFLEGYRLLREGSARHLLLSGGNVFPIEGVAPESELLARELERWGISPERIVIEGRSRNTFENATYSAEIVRARGWRKLLLVTSAAHMARAEGCFRAAGLEVHTLPVDHRSSQLTRAELLPRPGALSLSSDALRELAGRWVYRLRGYSAVGSR